MRISDWSADVCSSDLDRAAPAGADVELAARTLALARRKAPPRGRRIGGRARRGRSAGGYRRLARRAPRPGGARRRDAQRRRAARSEEHTSELQSLMRISYAVFCLKKNTNTQHTTHNAHIHNYNPLTQPPTHL